MSDTIEDEKFVELNYKVVDNKTGDILVTVDYPLAYVHGVNDVMSEEVTKELYGKKVGDIIEVPIDTTQLYGERDESMVFTDRIENVPKEYREIGMTITMENEKGEPRNFIVTRFDDKTLTVDGNNPFAAEKSLSCWKSCLYVKRPRKKSSLAERSAPILTSMKYSARHK